MITPEEEHYILSRAYVPEHIVSLMAILSKGEPFLIEDYLCLFKDNWLIFVGYPLGHDFKTETLERTLKAVMERFQPDYTWCIAPEVPPSLSQSCQEREGDEYYRLEVQEGEIKRALRSAVIKASDELTVERGREIVKDHMNLISEFLEKERPNPLVRELFLSMPEYTAHSKTSVVLNAWDKKKNLSAFYIVELAAEQFAAYIVGCYSRKNYVSHASDLLFFEMLNLAREYNKSTINLGLGVNRGIRRFKEKWGGVAFLRYEFCELRSRYSATLRFLRAIESKL